MPQMQNYNCPTCNAVVTGFKYFPRCLECGDENVVETDELTEAAKQRATDVAIIESDPRFGTGELPASTTQPTLRKLHTGKNAAWEKLMTTAMTEGRMTNLKNSRDWREPAPPQQRNEMSPFVMGKRSGDQGQPAGNNALASLFPAGVDPVKAALALKGGYATPYGGQEKLTSRVTDASGRTTDPTQAVFAQLKGKGPVTGTSVRAGDDARDRAAAMAAGKQTNG